MRSILAGSVCLALSAAALAAPPEATPGFPQIKLKRSNSIVYDATTGMMSLDGTPRTITFEDKTVANAGTPPLASVETRLYIDGEGGLVGGIPGDDLVVTGEIDLDGDGTADYSGVLLTGEIFQFGHVPVAAAPGPLAGAAGTTGGTFGADGGTSEIPREVLCRFAPTGGELVDYFDGMDIGVLLRTDPVMQSFDEDYVGNGRGTIGALETIRGACCTFGDFCSVVTELECDGLGGDFQGVGSECLAPDSPADTGRHLLTGRPFGGAADAGLVLTALDGDPASTFVYSFTDPGAEVFLDYDGGVAHIYGTAFGGKLVGGAIEPGTYEELRIDFAYSNATSDGTEITAPGSAFARGFIVRLGADQIVVLENGMDGLLINAAGELTGDLNYFGSSRGTVRMFNATLSQAIETCELDSGACCLTMNFGCAQTSEDACDALSGTYNGTGSSCDGDMDGDGNADICDRCEGSDDNEDCDWDWIPDGCEPDSDGDGVPDDCDVCPGGDDTQDCDHDGIPDDCDDNGGGDCPPAGTDRYVLSNHPDGSVATPFYGLRLDELIDVSGGQDIFTFDFDHPQSDMLMDITATTIRIYGVSYGGLDTGTGYDDPTYAGVWDIDMLYNVGVGPVPGDDDLQVAADGDNTGTIEPQFLATGPINLADKANTAGLSFRLGDDDDDLGHRGFPGTSGWGWLTHPNDPAPGKADWLFTAELLTDCEEDCDNDGTPDACEPDSDGDGVPDDCDICPGGDDNQDSDGDGIPDDCDAACTEDTEVSWDFDACWSFSSNGTNYDYSEFDAHEDGPCSVWGSNVYRDNAPHSCTSDRFGNEADAMCVGTTYYPPQIVPDEFVADSPEAVRFEIDVDSEGGLAILESLSFYQAAPDTFVWNQPGYNPVMGENNPPSLYGIRILRDGVEIFRQVDIPTTEAWSQEEFNFTGPDFEVAGGDALFEFELYSYAHVGTDMFNGGFVSAWDLDDMVATICCDAPPEPPTGACCRGGGCHITDEETCDMVGGEYKGDDSDCGDCH